MGICTSVRKTYTEKGSYLLQRHKFASSKISTIRNFFIITHLPSISVSTHQPPTFKCNPSFFRVISCRRHSSCHNKVVLGDRPSDISNLDYGWGEIEIKERQSEVRQRSSCYCLSKIQRCVLIPKPINKQPIILSTPRFLHSSDFTFAPSQTRKTGAPLVNVLSIKLVELNYCHPSLLHLNPFLIIPQTCSVSFLIAAGHRCVSLSEILRARIPQSAFDTLLKADTDPF